MKRILVFIGLKIAEIMGLVVFLGLIIFLSTFLWCKIIGGIIGGSLVLWTAAEINWAWAGDIVKKMKEK